MAKKFLDEKEAGKIFENGFIEYNWLEMVAYARFAHKHFEWSAVKIERQMREIFKNNGVNLVPIIDTMKSAISKRKLDFLEQDKVIISRSEIEKIRDLRCRDYQKITLSLLVMAKQKGIFWGEKPALFGSRKDVGDIMRTKVSVYLNKEEFDRYSTYIGRDMNYVNFHISRGDVGKWIISFANENSEVYKEVTDFSNLRTIIPFWCVSCGDEIPRGKYCKNCK